MPYILGTGESVSSVAQKYGMSVDELKKLNSYRTFSKPFAALTTGDEIDVPRMLSPFSAENNPTTPTENKLAAYAITGGTALASSNISQSAEQLARSVATNQLNDSAQKWLNQFGTARVQLGINDGFHLDGSAIEILLPAFDNRQNLLFTQLGLRNKDSRNTLNTGAGFRTLQNNWMYGINSFFDSDMSGSNYRLGLGAEAWTNYLKLSANSYFGLTDWHQSRDFADYNERPANGYDVRAEAYLPAYPQLGGKLMYEQYLGDEIELFGKESRQKDPYTLTAGINYTPFPLVTFSAEHRAGKSGQSDNNLNIQFNYHLGQSWQSHIDPSAVAANRSLLGSRYDLVERNNKIVLDYQKQELIRLSLPELVTGEAHSTVTVTGQVTSKYGLERIEWDSAELVAGGGTLTPISPQAVVIKLPAYQKARSTNLYVLNAIAYDRQGNISPRVAMRLSVIPGSAEISSGNLTVTRDNALSNGNASNVVQAVVTDADNNPISGQIVTFTADNNAKVNTVVGTTDIDGIAIAEITNTRAGISRITAAVNSSNQSVEVTFLADSGNLDPAISSLIALPTTIVADGTSASTLTLTLKDRNANLVTGQSVSFISSLTNSNISPVTDNGDGIYTAHLTGITAGKANITVTVDGAAFDVQPVNVTLIAGNLSIANSTLTALPTTIVADGSAAALITLTLRDINSNPVSGKTVTFASSIANSSVGSVTDQGDGRYTASLTGTTAGSSNITALVGGSAFGVTAAQVTLTADNSNLDTSQSTLTAAPGTILADGSAAALITLTLRDINSNPVSGKTVTFASSIANSSVGSVTDQGDGRYTASLTGTTAGSSNITALVGGSAFGVTAAQVTLTADNSNLGTTQSTLTAAPGTLVADGSAAALITLTLRDINSNPVSGKTVTFASSLANSSVGSVTDQGDGRYTASLTGTTAGSSNITALVGGSAFGVTAAQVTLTADGGNLGTTQSTLTAAPGTLVADGSAAALITLTLRDINSNPVSGKTVTFASSIANSSVGTVTDQGDGRYTASLTGTTAGSSNITALVGGSAFGVTAAQVTLTADGGNLGTTQSTLTAVPGTILADGSAAALITLTLRDINNNPVSGKTVTFASSLANSSVGSVTDQGDGRYTASLTGTTAGSSNITALVGGSAFGVTAAQVTLTADNSNLGTTQSTLTAAPGTLVADGSAAALITLTLRDINSNPVSGKTVTFASSLANSSVGSVTDQGDGRYTASLTGTTAGSSNITALVGGSAFGVTAAQVTLTADGGNLGTTQSTLTAAPGSIVADGSAAALITLTLRDINSNPVSGKSVTFASSLANSSVGTVTDQGDGRYTASLTGTTAGSSNITALVGGSAFGVTAAQVTLTADGGNLGTSQSTLAAAPGTIVADGSAAALITLTLRDINSNPVSGKTVTFASSLANSSVGSVTDQGDGRYTASLTGTTAGSSNITALVGGSAFGVTAAQVTLTADNSNLDTSQSTLTAAPGTIVADGSAAALITLTLRDINSNPVSGKTVTFASSIANSSVGSVTDQGDGRYTASLTGTTAGSSNITALVGGSAFGVTAAQVTLTADGGNLGTSQSTLTAVPGTIVADGSAAALITLTLRDINSNPVSGKTVIFASSIANSSVGSVTDQGDGRYTASLTGTTAGSSNITALVGGSAFGVTAAQVTLTADNSNLDTTQSTLTAAPGTIVADGSAAALITLTLRDINSNPVSGKTVTFASSIANSSVGSVTDQGDGRYTASLTGTTAGSSNITALVGGSAFGVTAAQVTLTADNSNLGTTQSTLTAAPGTLVADGSAAALITLTLRDINSNPVSGKTVTFASSLANSSVGSVTDQGDGRYTASLTGTTAGSSNITALVGGSAFGVTAAQVTLTADNSNLGTTQSTLTAAPGTLVADGSAAALITLTLRDINSNPVSGKTVTFASSLANSSVGSVTDQGDGRYTASLTGTTAGSSNITALVGGSAFGVTAAQVTLTADGGNLGTSQSTLTAAPGTIVADGSAAALITLTLRDINSNPVSGKTVTFASSIANSSVGTVTDQGDGRYTASLTGTTAGSSNITALVGGSAFGVTAAQVTLTADGGNLGTTQSTLTAAPSSPTAVPLR